MPAQSIPLAADARERFLLAIAETVAPERIAEVHLFPPIRAGTLETGVAVIAAEAEGSPAAVDADAAIPSGVRPSRHVVYSARYRWTRKGPDRGKWEHEVVAEADAPLVTVEAVVRGVQERANESVEPDRLNGDAARALIHEARCRITP